MRISRDILLEKLARRINAAEHDLGEVKAHYTRLGFTDEAKSLAALALMKGHTALLQATYDYARLEAELPND